MLSQTGGISLGHGVIKQIRQEVLDAQLQKRLFNYGEYDEKIIEEFKKEQPLLYATLEAVADTYGKDWADVHEIEGTDSYDKCLEYWKYRLVHLMAFQYKLISVGIEVQWMEEV